MKHTFTTDCSTLLFKPDTKWEVINIYENFDKHFDATIYQFYELFREYRFVYAPAKFVGKKKNENWKHQSIFVLDFDQGVHYDEILQKTEKYGLQPNIVYNTFSHKDAFPKYRFMFFLDKVITDKPERDYIQRGLIALYEDSDKSCKDAARMFYPFKLKEHAEEKNIFLISDEEVSYDLLKSIIDTAIISADGNRVRHLKQFNSDYKFDEIKTIDKFDFQKARKRIKILDDFLSYKWLYHNQLFGIATSLVHIKGGMKLMKETMQKFNEINLGRRDEHGNPIQYTENNLNIIKSVNKSKYAPMNLKNYSPYESDYRYSNILRTHYKKEKNTVEIIERKEIIPLKDAEEVLQDSFHNALKSDVKVVLIKAVAGLGKTKLLETIGEKAVLAFPTNQLKEEVSARLKYEHVVTPELPDFTDTSINHKLIVYYNAKRYDKASSLLRTIAASKHPTHNLSGDIALALTYLKDLDECANTEKTIVTTHSRAIHNRFDKHKTIIFDEDPLGYLSEINSMNHSIFEEICGDLSLLKMRLLELKINGKESTIMPLADLVDEDFKISLLEKLDGLLKNDAHINKIKLVMKFLNCTHFYINKKKVVFGDLNKSVLDKADKIIIMSATANENIYQQIFGSELEVYDITNVECKGKIYQDISQSFSKSMLSRVELSLNNTKYKEHSIITFKADKVKYENADNDMHFFHSAGFDKLNGKDLIVIGTPHLPKEIYLLMGAIIGYDISNGAYHVQSTIYNGMKFRMMTFVDEKLRDLQLRIIQGELTQVIHRSRILRNDCEVLLFSNFPIYNANYMELIDNMNVILKN